MKARLITISIVVTSVMVLTPVAYAAPGDVLAHIKTDVNSPSGVAIGIAVDCGDPAILYYTHSYEPNLYMMDANGTGIGAPIPLTDSNGGQPISFGAISWDATRQKLWAGTDDGRNPVEVYLVDPTTGVSTYICTLMNAHIGFDDGIAFDGSDDSLWVTDDVSTWVEHWDVSGIDVNGVGAASHIGTIHPNDANGNPLTLISGVAVGKGDILYLGRNGLGKITRVHKDGTFDSEFVTVGGRDEDLECDVVSFAPLEVLWSKDAYDNTLYAIEVETGTCVCPGAENLPPDCSDAYADPACLWPPNHKMVPVKIMGVTDPDGDPNVPVTIIITKITSDEATATELGAGGPKHAPDAAGVGTDTAWLRAERSGRGNGRVYVIKFTAVDPEGAECRGRVKVRVPHDQRPSRRSPVPCKARNDGQKYDATQINEASDGGLSSLGKPRKIGRIKRPRK